MLYTRSPLLGRHPRNKEVKKLLCIFDQALECRDQRHRCSHTEYKKMVIKLGSEQPLKKNWTSIKKKKLNSASFHLSSSFRPRHLRWNSIEEIFRNTLSLSIEFDQVEQKGFLQPMHELVCALHQSRLSAYSPKETL